MFEAILYKATTVLSSLLVGTAVVVFSQSAFGVSQQVPTFIFNVAAGDMAVSPAAGLLSAAIPKTNQIALFDTSNLSEDALISLPAGASPDRMTFSPDGSTLYVNEPGLNSVVAINTSTHAITSTYSFGDKTADVAFAASRLFVLHGGSFEDAATTITSINPSTGATAGPDFSGSASYFVRGGSLAVSPDANTLYYGNGGIEPCGAVSLGISAAGALSIQQNFTAVTSGYSPLSVSHNGSMLNYPCLLGNFQLGSSTFAEEGTYNVDPGYVGNIYGCPIPFSEDDTVAFLAEYVPIDGTSRIDEISTSTFADTGQLVAPPGAIPSYIQPDSTGSHVWVSLSNGTLAVYNVPEPASVGLLWSITVVLLRRNCGCRERKDKF